MFKKILAIVAIAVVPVVAFAQGTVNFDTKAITVKVTDMDGAACLGTGFFAQLYAAAGTGVAESALVAVGSPVNFRTGINAGYVVIAAPVVPSVFVFQGGTAGGPATVQMRAWSSDYTTYEAAEAAVLANTVGAQYGKSVPISLAATGNPPATPPNLVGLTGFQLVGVPEPSTLALVLLGGAALLIRRRK